MSPTLAIVLWWIAFGVTHAVLSSIPVRARLVQRIGEPAFRGAYSLLAIALFVMLVRTYFAHKHAGVWLWTVERGPLLYAVMYVGMALSCILVVAGLLRPSPANVVPGDPTPRGALRLTRHPTFMSLVLFGLLHLLPNGSSADVAFFGGFVVFTLLGAWHQDQRKLAVGVPGFRAFYAATPFWPFTGRETLQGIRELGPLVIGLGLALAVTVRYFHAAWFGG